MFGFQAYADAVKVSAEQASDMLAQFRERFPGKEGAP